MGNFYVNYTLRGPGQQDVARVLTGREAIVTAEHSGCIVAFDAASDMQDPGEIAGLGALLSSDLRCPVLAVLNHDDDILWYQLYEDGELADEYNSSPDYFDSTDEPSGPEGGDARRLCAAFGSNEVAKVERILRTGALDDGGYVFAFERHADLAKALGLPEGAVGTAYASFDRDEIPPGLTAEEMVRTS